MKRRRKYGVITNKFNHVISVGERVLEYLWPDNTIIIIIIISVIWTCGGGGIGD